MENEKKFISLLSDYGFKTVFADETDTEFLRRALQALIKSKVPIEKVEFLRNEFSALTQEGRGGIFDLVCTDEHQRTFIVEMQLGYYKHFVQRAKFYAFQKFNTLVSRGKYKFEDLTQIYTIGFLGKEIIPHSKEYYHFVRLKNQKGEEIDEQITHVIVEISKFEKKASEVKTDLDKLIFIMKNLERINDTSELPKFLKEGWLEKAIKKLDKSSMTATQRMQYEMMLAKSASVIEMLKEEERLAIEKKAEKRAEKRKAIDTADKLIPKGMTNLEIHEITGLSVEEIEKLRGRKK